MAGILISNLIKEEDIARQRSPLDSNIYAEMLRRSNASLSLDLEQRTLFNITTIGRYLGPRVSECACCKPSDQPRDAARREECSNWMKRV